MVRPKQTPSMNRPNSHVVLCCRAFTAKKQLEVACREHPSSTVSHIEPQHQRPPSPHRQAGRPRQCEPAGPSLFHSTDLFSDLWLSDINNLFGNFVVFINCGTATFTNRHEHPLP